MPETIKLKQIKKKKLFFFVANREFLKRAVTFTLLMSRFERNSPSLRIGQETIYPPYNIEE